MQAEAVEFTKLPVGYQAKITVGEVGRRRGTAIFVDQESPISPKQRQQIVERLRGELANAQ